jgi:hypothetical protein
MPVDTSSLLALALLVFAATCAAYLLSRWSRLFGGRSALAQWACGIGVVALLAASTAYFLSIVSPMLSSFVAFDAEPIPSATPTAVGFPERPNRSTVAPASSDAHEHASAQSAPTGTSTRTRSGALSTALGDIATERSSAMSKATPRRHLESARANHLVRTLGTNPWGATDCVFQIQPDPSRPDLWWLENECDAPVGIVVAACSESAASCDAHRSTSWTYAPAMYLPSKQQRSVTFAEQTQRGQRIRFIACVITNRTLIDLLGSDIGSHSRQWRAAVEALNGSDGCAEQVQGLTDAGRRSPQSIDELVGANLPGRVRQARDRVGE